MSRRKKMNSCTTTTTTEFDRRGFLSAWRGGNRCLLCDEARAELVQFEPDVGDQHSA